jgi:hypothetical protein
MRRRRSTEQRLWLGPGGYLCGGRRRSIAYAYGDGNCYGNTNGDSFNTHAYTDVNCAPHSNSQRYSALQSPADTTSSALRIG